MNNRQKEILQYELEKEKDLLRDLKLVYGQAQDDVVNKIIDLSRRTDMENLQTIIYQKQYQEAIKGQIDGILDKLHSDQYSTISEYINDCYSDSFIGVLYDLQGQGIPLIFPIDQKQVVKAVQIDSKLSKSLYESLDMADLKKAVRMEVSRGIVNGSSWNQIGAELAKKMGNTPFQKAINNSIRIARTEGHRVQNQAKLDSMNAAKEKGADVVKQWDSTLDGKTRDTHRKLDGQIRELDEDFEVDGMTASAPGMFGDPAEDCNCRCQCLQRARWALDSGFTKMDNFTKELKSFESTSDYEQFKKDYWSKENIDYMNYVSDKEEKYGTKDFEKLLGYMTDREYNHYQKLVDKNPLIDTIVSEKSKSSKVNITDIAISKVKEVSLDGFSMSEIEQLQGMHKDLLKTAMTENDSNEVVRLFGKSFDDVVTIIGTENTVNLNESIEAKAFMLKAKERSVIMIHNHPTGTSFSYDDIGTFLQGEIQTMTVVTNKGKVFALNKKESFDILGIIGKIKEIRGEYENPIEHQEEIAKKILKEISNYGVEYVK